MPPVVRVAALVTSGLIVLAGCTDSPPPEGPATSAAESRASATATEQTLSAKQRATQLSALAPSVFDATYRLQTRGKKRPDAKVQMRAKGERFRLDVQQGRSTAVLFTSRRGVVSCQIRDVKEGKNERACFLVAKQPKGLPALFDPQVQRLFRSTTERLSRNRNGLTVTRAKTWQAPKPYGPAECFDVRGPDVDRGTYCYLSSPSRYIGLLARVKFPSGALELRSVNRSIRPETFQPPVRPTPLPN
jgi:hypothetical protein